MFCKTVLRASQVSGGRNQWDGWFLPSQQLTEHRTTPNSQCQLKRRCVSNMSAFVLLLMKLHQREFPKAASKQVKKAGVKPPYKGCTISLNYPRGFKNALSHICNGSCTEGQTMGRTILGKSRSLPCAEAEWSYTIHQHQKQVKHFPKSQKCTVVSTSKAERELATQKLQHHPLAQCQGWLPCWNSGRCWAGPSLQLDLPFRWYWDTYLFA